MDVYILAPLITLENKENEGKILFMSNKADCVWYVAITS